MSDPRLRPHPDERFAVPEEVIDLNAAIDRLQRESSGQHGHRQMALFRHGAATLALYNFDAGAKLPDHVVDGAVILHTLDGRLRISTAQHDHDLPAGSVLRLAPGVRHDVTAIEPSQMLLTICVEGPDSHT